MTKYEYVKNCFIVNKIPLTSTKGIDYVLMACEGYRIAGCAPIEVTKFNKAYFPNKPKTVRVYTYLLGLNSLKICSACKQLLNYNNFHKSEAAHDKLQRICNSCNASRKFKRTPEWANLEAVKFWYECCPKGCEVDHIIPLHGKTISGLHIETNLQWLTQSQNRGKSNKWPYGKV